MYWKKMAKWIKVLLSTNETLISYLSDRTIDSEVTVLLLLRDERYRKRKPRSLEPISLVYTMVKNTKK